MSFIKKIFSKQITNTEIARRLQASEYQNESIDWVLNQVVNKRIYLR